MSLLAMEWREHQSPDPFETERVGHPKKPNQSLWVDVLEWYHPIVRVRQQDNAKGWATRQGRYWRIGFGRKGGLRVFRSVIFGWKKDWWIGGPL
jgi:hypothetical protein